MRRGAGDAITISRVSRRAGVTRKSIYRHDDLVARIRAHRPMEAVTDDTPSIPQTGRFADDGQQSRRFALNYTLHAADLCCRAD